MVQCNVLTPLAIIKRILPQMLIRKRGYIFQISSSSINLTPKFSVKEGGWDFGYSSTKAAISKLLPLLAIEHRKASLRFYNIEPGLVETELMKQR